MGCFGQPSGLASPQGVASEIIGVDEAVVMVRPVSDAEFDRNLGLVENIIAVRKFGRNCNTSVAVETVWSRGGTYVFPQSAQPLRVAAGGAAADTAIGSGANKIHLEFLDGDWNPVVEELTLSGAAASASTVADAMRLNRAWIVTTGTYHGSNVGDIVIEQETSGIVVGEIPLGLGQTQQAVYSVRAGFTAQITDVFVSVGSTNSATVRMMIAEGADDTSFVYNGGERMRWSVQDISAPTQKEFKKYIEIPEKSDIRMDAQRVTGGGDAEVSADFDLLLVEN